MVRIRMHDQGSQKNYFPIRGETPFFSSPFSKTKIPNLSGLLWIREDITYFRYPKLFRNRQLIHGVFTRRGGMSNSPYNELNISYTVGDQPGNVSANLLRIKEELGIDQLAFMNQCHGDSIAVIRQRHFSTPFQVPSVDAMITNIPGIALMVKQADCQGVIIFDPKRGALANVHCGWRGNVQNILGKVVAKMKQEFGCREHDLMAAIGPSLGPCCTEFITYEDIFPKSFKRFMVRENHFDLWTLSCWQLLEAGLREENIEVAGICSRCNTDLFYSYRADGITGRFGSVAILR